MRHSAKLLAFSCVLLSSAAYGAGSTAPGIVPGNSTAVAGHCWQVAGPGVAIDSGATCGTGASGVSQSTGTASQVLVNGDTASHTGATTYSLPAGVSLGTPGSAAGSLGLAGATSGTVSLASPATGGGTLTLPAGTDTLVGRATTDTLTNKSVSGSTNTITNVPLTTAVTGVLPVANGGSGTSTPGIVAGTNVTVTGSWPNQTVNSSGGGGGGTPGGATGTVQYNNAGVFGGVGPGTLDDILHGGAAGPTFAPVNLSTVQVTGILGAANGGAGSTVGILKANGAGAVSQAVSGLDYAPATSGGSILAADTFGGFSPITVGSGLTFTGGTLAATGGGSVSLSSGSSNIVVNPNPITGTGTISATYPVNAQTGTTYALVAADGGKLVTLNNASAVAVSLPQAGTTGFPAGWSTTVQNLGAGTGTVTPATSTINGLSTLVIPHNTGCDVNSDGTNYQVSACTAIASGGSTGANPTATASDTAVNGSATTFMRSDASPAIQKATAAQFGLVEVDGTTITATGGVISAVGGGGGAVSSVSNSDGSLTVSPTTGAVVASLNTAHTNNWSVAQQNSAAGALSAPALLLSGTTASGGTGTTTLPLFYMNGSATAPATWNTSGTIFGINSQSFIGNFIDFHDNGGVSEFSVNSTGLVTVANQVVASAIAVNSTTAPVVGINRPATNTLGLVTNSGIRMEIDATGNPYFLSMTSATTAQTGTVCINNSSSPVGELTFDPTNTCLSSLEELKDSHGSITSASALWETMKLNPFWGTWKKTAPAWIGGDRAEQPFLGAHGVEKVDPRLASYDSKGKLRSVRYQEMVAFLVADVQGLQEEIAALFVLILGLVGWNIYLTRKVMS